MGDSSSPPLFDVTGGILAGGHSSRFGSNKALFSPNGETLIERAAGLLRPLCRQVLVSASHTNAEAYAFLGLDIVEDLHSDCGPLGGLEAMLNRCTTPWLLVLTCDMPYVSSEALQTMVSHAQLSDALDESLPRAFAWQRASDGSISPFPLLIKRSVLPQLREQMRHEHFGVKAFLRTVDTYYIKTDSAQLLSNINRPEDWQGQLI
mgnify:FL=1